MFRIDSGVRQECIMSLWFFNGWDNERNENRDNENEWDFQRKGKKRNDLV